MPRLSQGQNQCMSGGISPETQAHLRAYGLRRTKARESVPVIALDLHLARRTQFTCRLAPIFSSKHA